MMGRLLTNKKIQFIRDNYKTMTDKQIGQAIGVVKGTVTSVRKRLNLYCSQKEILRRRGVGNIGKSVLQLSAYQKMKIKRDYLDKPVKRLAKELGISDTALKGAMKRMCLVVPRAVIEQRKNDTRFKKGQMSANKGKKQLEYMSAEAIARSAKTRFSKGHIPPNTKDRDGVITIRHEHPGRSTTNGRPYKYIRVSKGKWKPLHQYLWENKYGRVPAGKCLWFKDGNSLNVNLSNLEIISRRENRLRNSASKKLTDRYVAFTLASRMHPEMVSEFLKQPELIKIKRSQLQLNRAINDKEGNRQHASRHAK